MKNPVSGMDYTIPGKSLHVWQRQADGSWKILLDLNNMDIVL
jgi:ketosteroid isomerase-like protein